MPFISLNSQIPGVSIGLWKIEEDEFFFLERVKLYENEWIRLGEIVHPQKRLEWLSSRLCLKELLKIANTSRVESLNTQSGKPYLSNNAHNISYTHSARYSAAIASKPLEVGIDIEDFSRKRNPRTRFLFMNEPELSFYEQNPDPALFLLIWSAKETLYKIMGRGFAFKENLFLHLEDFSLNSFGDLPATVAKDDLQQDFTVRYIRSDDYLLTYTTELTPAIATPVS